MAATMRKAGLTALTAWALTFGGGAAAQDHTAELLKLEQKLNGLGERIERLEDEKEIERLQRSYGYYVDKAQWPAVADLFAEDGTYEIGGRGIFIGPDRVLEYLTTGLGSIGMDDRHGQVIDHTQLQGLVTIGPDGKTAKGRWTALVMSVVGANEERETGSAGWGDVYYENVYVKEDGIWKFKEVRAPFIMYTNYEDGWAHYATPNTRPDSFPPPPDLPPSEVYLTYPSFYVVPYHYDNPVTGEAMPEPHPAAGGTAPMEALDR